MQFDIAISLGDSCETRYHLRRISQARVGNDADGGGFFWDWQWRDSGVQGIVNVLDANFSLDFQDFEVRSVLGSHEAYNRRYGLYFTHDFNFVDVDETELEAALAIQWEEVAVKYDYLSRKTRAVLGPSGRTRRVLLVLCGQATEADATVLSDALRRFGLREFTVLHVPFLNRDQTAVRHPDFYSFPISSMPWPGNSDAWDEAFQNIQVLPVPSDFGKTFAEAAPDPGN